MDYLIDTCIWIDLLEDRKGSKKEPFGIYASKFFLKNFKNIIYTTDITIQELKGKLSNDEIFSLFRPFKIRTIFSSKKQFEESFVISNKLKIPKGDALHAIIARDNNLMIITRDKHFKQINFCKSKKPEELI